MTRLLAISDEVSEVLYGDRLQELDADIVVSCGDLPFDYLEYVVTLTNVPLVWVPGNHDPRPETDRMGEALMGVPFIRPEKSHPFGPEGGTNIDGRIVDVKGLRIAGLGGSIRYSDGVHQYTESQMARRGHRLARHARWRQWRDGRAVDVLATHSPPRGAGDDHDPAHRGFESFRRLVEMLSPRLMIHGHVHPHGRHLDEHRIGTTTVVNVVGYRLLEVDP